LAGLKCRIAQVLTVNSAEDGKQELRIVYRRLASPWLETVVHGGVSARRFFAKLKLRPYSPPQCVCSMASLANLPEVVGFFSYSREDDADSHGALSTLRNRIQGELRGQLGRTAKTFRLWQDKEAIPAGTLWEAEIKTAVEQSVFFIPIITPTVVASPYCKFELESFLAREAALDRHDLVFPILYIDVPALEDPVRRQNDPVLSLIAKRQYVDWREFRHLDVNSTEVKRQVERFCSHIRDALHRPWISPEERRVAKEAEARLVAENEAKAQRLVEEQKRLHEEKQRFEAEKTDVQMTLRQDACADRAIAGQRDPDVQRDKKESRKLISRRSVIIGGSLAMPLIGAIGYFLGFPPWQNGVSSNYSGPLQFQGAYRSPSTFGPTDDRYVWFRFYRDGRVVQKWLSYSNAKSASFEESDAPRYEISGSRIRFSIPYAGKPGVDYEGTISWAGMTLNSYSHINGNRSTTEFVFVPF
jgi:hypothetical protein